MLDTTFGSFIREKRKEKGISLRKLTELIDMSPVHLSNLENDRRPAPKATPVSASLGRRWSQ